MRSPTGKQRDVQPTPVCPYEAFNATMWTTAGDKGSLIVAAGDMYCSRRRRVL